MTVEQTVTQRAATLRERGYCPEVISYLRAKREQVKEDLCQDVPEADTLRNRGKLALLQSMAEDLGQHL